MVRILLAAAAAFVISAAVGWVLIPILRALHAGQSIKEIGPNWHKNKEGTPTMGGIMFIAAVIVVVLAFGWQDMAGGNWQALFVLGFSLVCGAIGFVDDYAKIRKHENTGLTAGWKFLLQLAAAIAFTVLMRGQGYLTPNLFVPFFNVTFPLPWVVYMVFAAFVMVGTVNAVNLTDGIDGLATGVTIPVALFYMAVSAWFGRNDLAILSAALAGGLAAFLIYNFHPAKVFMGDTGSLFLGGAVCGLAFAYDKPLILIFVGVVYILETLSDILQVFYFKLTKRRTGEGKRIFLMAPLHHHYEKKGWSEEKVVVIFTLVSCIGCALGYLGYANWMIG